MKKLRKYLPLIPAILILVLVISGIGVWRDYRDTLMENQENQLLIVTRILRDNLKVSMEEYQDNLEFISGIESNHVQDQDSIYQRFLDTQQDFICDLYREDEQGNIIYSVTDTDFRDPALLAEYSDGKSIWMMSDDETHYIVFKKKETEGTQLCLAVDAVKYYQRLISDIHVGTNGYIVVKNKEGTIIMHPDKEQWGEEVIEGRKERFPDLDYSSLEEMLKEQSEGKEGISRYYSYWWTKPKIQKTEKISAYCSAEMGQDAWIVSAVIDYDDFYAPIAEGFLKISLIFSLALVLVGILVLIYGRLLRTVHKSSREIKNLKELNALLENIQKSEDAIAHQERLQIMGTMTGGIAHEFNNFLTPIMGHAELLMMELPEGSDEQDSAKEILEASEKAMDVVKQISSLSRKNVETVYKCIPVKKMMQRALKMITSVCPPQVHLESDIQIDQENILGNATQLNQVLLNICVNAIHAIGKKEGMIHVTCEVISRETLAGFLDKELPDTWSDYIYISIRDNGCGMEKETLRQIFDPFFTTKKGGEGTGLGLALVEQIVTSHKGYVFAESQPGVGSCFHIGLPVLHADQSEEIVQVGERHEIRMVFADDNAKVLELLHHSFDKIGIQIQTCMTIEELSANLAEKEADVLVIEENIEGQSSVDFCMSIAGKYPKMLKLVSIESISREIVEAKKKGIIHGYVEKPLSDRNVLEAVRECQKEQGLY